MRNLLAVAVVLCLFYVFYAAPAAVAEEDATCDSPEAPAWCWPGGVKPQTESAAIPPEMQATLDAILAELKSLKVEVGLLKDEVKSLKATVDGLSPKLEATNAKIEALDGAPSGSAPAPGGPKPDLVVTKLASSNDPVAGESITYAVWVQNVGVAAAELKEPVTMYRVSPSGKAETIPTAPTWTKWPGEASGLINPGEKIFLGTIPDVGPMDEAGTWTIHAYADGAGLVAESDESNNARILEVEVKPKPKADLVVTKFAFSNPNPLAGESITYSVWVKNAGDAPITGYGVAIERGFATGGFTLLDSEPEFKKGPDATPFTLDPGEEVGFIGIPDKWPLNDPGSYYMRAVVSAVDSSLESDTLNNGVAHTLVVEPQPAPKPAKPTWWPFK